MTGNISTQKEKLAQKKARLTQQEALLKIKERKSRVRRLIELGGIMVKAKIDHLPSDVMLGACLSIKDELDSNDSVLGAWQQRGASVFKQDVENKTAVVLQLNNKPGQDIRNTIRTAGLKWNAIRKEWYGYVCDLPNLKAALGDLKFKLDILDG